MAGGRDAVPTSPPPWLRPCHAYFFQAGLKNEET